MNAASRVQAWLPGQSLTASDIDCVTTVMLKILDGKCKMDEAEKSIMTALYDAVRSYPGLRFGAVEHALIACARQSGDEALKLLVYERRVLAETALSRPVMKAFKAMIRYQGLFAGYEHTDEETA